MEKKRYSAEKIISKLRQVESLTAEGATISQAIKQIEVSERTYCRWKKLYGGMERDQLRRLKELEKENARLRKFVADLTLDKDILKEALGGSTEPVAPS